MEQVYDVFISYSRKDYLDDNQNVIPNNVVSIIKETLIREGISFWFDEEGIYSGQNFIEKIVNNIESSKLFLYLSTANANSSRWTCKEIASANEFGKPIIPVRIDKSPYNKKVMFLISDLDYIEYYANPENGLRDMVLSIKAHLQTLKEEEERKRLEEEKKREEELRRQEEERRRKEEEERRIQEEQKRIVSEIELACTKLNTEEKKIDLDRSTLLVDTERVIDAERKEQLRSFITSSSPIRQKLAEEIKKLEDRILKLEAEITSTKAEKERLQAKLEQAQSTSNGNAQEQISQLKDKISKIEKERDYLERDLGRTMDDRNRLSQQINKLNEEVDRLKKQLKEQTKPTGTATTSSKPNKKLHIIYGIAICTLLGIGIWQVLHWRERSDYWERQSDYYYFQFYDANESIEKLSEGYPFVITDICVYNETGSCGDSIISSLSTYLIPRIYTYCPTSDYGEYQLDIKIYDPLGNLRDGSSSPEGYCYSKKTYISYLSDYEDVGRWGGKQPGHWEAGKYRIEVWYDGKMMKSKEFEIY